MRFLYERDLDGMVLKAFHHESTLLEGNPLGDPASRSHPLLLPTSGVAGLPLGVLLVGYTGFGHKVINKSSLWQENLPERIARLTRNGDLPPAVWLWPSCETRWGGSQYRNSAGTGPYEDFLVEELIPAVEADLRCGGDGNRVVAGKSSGGYGALVLCMRRPAFFAAAASHAGDLGVDLAHVRGFPDALQCWRKHGGIGAFLKALPTLKLGFSEHAGVELYAMATVYSPNNEAPLSVDLPVDPETGEIQQDVFARWLEQDPLRMVDQPDLAEGLRQLSHLHLDAGEEDEFALQWGLRRLLPKLKSLGIRHTGEFFSGGHFDLDHRYEISLPRLLSSLSS